MSIKEDYYLKKYENLKVLSDSEKCKTILARNVDTGQLGILKETHQSAYAVYSKLKGVMHENLSQITDCFIYGDRCISLENYIDGRQLDSIIKEGDITSAMAIEYTIQLCHALSKLHELGIIHRDVQPKNIIITNEGILKLIDFDIARENKENVLKDTIILGTAGYASPEQYGFAQTDGRSDIYSAGVLLREMIAGNVSGTDEYITEKINKENLTEDCFVYEKRLLAILHKCTSIDADKRFENVKLLEKALCETKKEKRKNYEKIETVDNKKEVSKELPPVTIKEFVRSIPGFRERNYYWNIFALIIYGILIYMCFDIGLENGATIIKKIVISMEYLCMIFVPYVYLVNIGQIAERIPRRNFKKKEYRMAIRILGAIVLLLMIALCIGVANPELHKAK